jgi:hypothetical protein
MNRLILSLLFGSCLLLSIGCSGGNQPAPSPPAAKPITWEYTVMINESGEHFPPHLRKFVDEGWEVHLVTGGQPYVTASHTADGKTFNTVSFTRRDYYLKRQK